MSIFDSCVLQTTSAAQTALAGRSLTASLYRAPLTVNLMGEMGSGKTTFVQGFAKGLGLQERPVSPTFALEHRYSDQLCHIDLCRLNEKEAVRLLHHSDNFPGIRMIEWAEKSPDHDADISITFEDHRDSRRITCEFYDLPLPSQKDIESFADEVLLPAHIRKHMAAVAHVADILAADCLKRGRVVRTKALRCSALLHDILRFVDFKSFDQDWYEAPPTEHQKKRWMEMKNRYALRHEPSAARYLQEHGYKEIGEIIVTHRGTKSEDTPLPETIEQKLLCYADKRVDLERVVSLDERFKGLIKRHGKDATSPEELAWQTYIRQLEAELFPLGPPPL